MTTAAVAVHAPPAPDQRTFLLLSFFSPQTRVRIPTTHAPSPRSRLTRDVLETLRAFTAYRHRNHSPGPQTCAKRAATQGLVCAGQNSQSLLRATGRSESLRLTSDDSTLTAAAKVAATSADESDGPLRVYVPDCNVTFSSLFSYRRRRLHRF